MHQDKTEKSAASLVTSQKKGDSEKVLRAANLLHSNLQFTLETLNKNGKLAFLNLQITKTGKVTVGSIKNQKIQVTY